MPATATRPTTVTYTYHDPGRTFDGNVYEATGLAVAQSAATLKLFQRAISDTAIQVRNAHMQRNLDLGGPADAASWDDSPQKRIIDNLSNLAEGMQERLQLLHKAATYDPKNPPKE
jgi:hypothetical protein